MTRPFTPKIVTANELRAGHVIYLASDDGWVTDITLAEVLTDEADADLRLLHAFRQPDVAVGPYLAEVRQTPTGPEPVANRERFRVTGPTIRQMQRPSGANAPT